MLPPLQLYPKHCPRCGLHDPGEGCWGCDLTIEPFEAAPKTFEELDLILGEYVATGYQIRHLVYFIHERNAAHAEH